VERRFITVRKTAELLSVHSMSVRKWIDAGKIKAIRIGRSVRVDLRALEEQFNKQQEAGGRR